MVSLNVWPLLLAVVRGTLFSFHKASYPWRGWCSFWSCSLRGEVQTTEATRTLEAYLSSTLSVVSLLLYSPRKSKSSVLSRLKEWENKLYLFRGGAVKYFGHVFQSTTVSNCSWLNCISSKFTGWNLKPSTLERDFPWYRVVADIIS